MPKRKMPMHHLRSRDLNKIILKEETLKQAEDKGGSEGHR
jgi:hypothetical protein